jgi:hypothetical protein
VLTVFAVVAFSTGTPLFLGLGTLAIPILMAFLAFVARQQIRASEGVLSGLALTTWAWWLSVLFGLGFAAYYVGTYLAVSWQAEDFTAKWLEKLRTGKVNQAFWDTLDPGKRRFEKPDDADYMYQHYGVNMGPRKGPLAVFQDHEVTRLLRMASQEGGSVAPLGVRNWSYEKGGYRVEELFQVTTLEGVYGLVIPVVGIQSKEFEGRQWQVNWGDVVFGATTLSLTELGNTLAQWRQESRLFAHQWLDRRERGSESAILDTLAPAQRDQAVLPWLSVGASCAMAGPGYGVANLGWLVQGHVRCRSSTPSISPAT